MAKKFLKPAMIFALLIIVLAPLLAGGSGGDLADRKASTLMGWDSVGKTFTSSLIIIHVGQMRLTAVDKNDIRAQSNIYRELGLDFLKRIGRVYIDFEPQYQQMVPGFVNFHSERALEFTYEVIDLYEGDPVGRFISFEDPYQREAKTYLREIAKRESEFYSKKGRYADNFRKIDVTIPQGCRYSYYLSPTECVASGSCGEFPSQIRELSRFHNFRSDENSFTAFALSNNDNDDTLDVWMVDSSGRVTSVVDDVLR